MAQKKIYNLDCKRYGTNMLEHFTINVWEGEHNLIVSLVNYRADYRYITSYNEDNRLLLDQLIQALDDYASGDTKHFDAICDQFAPTPFVYVKKV